MANYVVGVGEETRVGVEAEGYTVDAKAGNLLSFYTGHTPVSTFRTWDYVVEIKDAPQAQDPGVTSWRNQ
jgi:hypothetical protein